MNRIGIGLYDQDIIIFYIFLNSVLLPPFHNVSHSSISYIHIDVNESIHIYLDSLTSI
mgnify:CR=1 FL=1